MDEPRNAAQYAHERQVQAAQAARNLQAELDALGVGYKRIDSEMNVVNVQFQDEPDGGLTLTLITESAEGKPGFADIEISLTADQVKELRSRPQPGWISIADGLPEDGQAVLAYWPVPGYVVHHTVARFYEAKASPSLRGFWIDISANRKCFVTDNIVTHWMPLPPGPEVHP